ncbi:hypothetical protein QFC21_000937 [Naganishia friedmannii]|uniref:Uncharacterized protein n=1 Tax=Naganishia friedmannii TaxID=89922 RepID=A0ACC2W6W0_9TREE|nr:hypothetical protein QFC21_000937 [Naganishia friedmannii]
MASSTIAVPHSPASEKHQKDESLGGVGAPALLFYGPACRPARYKEPEDCPPSNLKGPKAEERSKSGDAKTEKCCKFGEGKPEKECKRKEAKTEKEVKCRGKEERARPDRPPLITKISSSSMVRFTEVGAKSGDTKEQMKQVIPIQTITKEVYCNGVLTHREITDCRQVTTVGYQPEEKGKVLDKKPIGSGADAPCVVENASKKPKSAVATAACEPSSKAKEPKKGKSLIPVMNNLMSMMRDTEVDRLKNNRLREKTTLNSIQGIAQWFLVSQAIAMMVFLILGIVFVNLFGLLFVVVLFSRR